MRARRPESASPSSAARRSRRWWLAALLPSLLLGGCVSAGAARPTVETAPSVAFDRHEVVLGPAPRPTVVWGFFLDGEVADLAVIDLGPERERRLRLFAFDGETWVEGRQATLGSDVLFVDVAGVAGHDRLITYAPGRLGWFDPESGEERPLAEVDTRYDAAGHGLHYGGLEPPLPVDGGEIPRLDISRDLTGDGRDDLVVPSVQGFWILVQGSDGSFGEARRLGPPEPFRDEAAFGDSRKYGAVGVTPLTLPWYLSRIHQMDHDRDGRTDLVFWNEDHFDVHHQNDEGRFETQPERLEVEVPFDSDGVYSLIFGFGDAGAFRLVSGLRKSTRQTVLHSLRDVDGDGVADLVTFTLAGRSLLRQRTSYRVHYGEAASGTVTFGARPAAVAAPPGRQTWGYSSARFEDLDGDGRLDLAVGRVKTGVGKMIRALVGRSLTMEFELFRNENGRYPDRPSARRRVRTAFDPTGGRDGGFFPSALGGDVHGDGRYDLLVGRSRRELLVFAGVPGPELVAREPQRVAVELPGDERNSWLADLDRDGRDDLLLHHASPTEPQRLLILLAR